MQKTEIRLELGKIKKTHGRLHAEDVVNAAKNPKCPLHSCFEWEDGKAAAAYRVMQARQLIRTAWVFLPAAKTSTRAFVSVLTDREAGGYRQTGDVVQTDAGQKEILRLVLSELNSWAKRSRPLLAACGIELAADPANELGLPLVE